MSAVTRSPVGCDGHDGQVGTDEVRDGVELTNLDQGLFEGAGATKRELVYYLDAMRDRILPELADRPLSVVRVLRGQAPFMQKNVPKYTPPWVRTVTYWAEKSKRDVAYAVCDDRRTLLWFANQRAVEYHVPLFRLTDEQHPNTMVLDIDPPEGSSFGAVVSAAQLIRHVLTEAYLDAAVKTSGAKGVHVLVPIAPTRIEDVAAATRATAARAERLDPQLATTAFVRDERAGKVFLDSTRAGGATIVAAYSPRLRPGLPVSFPVTWDELPDVAPADFTIHTVPGLLDGAPAWTLPAPQQIPADLVAEGHTIPVARVQAMHAGLRRARARRAGS
jgi:DNA ligase D-like protein (predicted polymerase)